MGASPLVEMLIKERYHVIVCHAASVGGRAAHHRPLHCLQGLLNTDCQSPLVILHVMQKSGSPAARGKPTPARIKVCTAVMNPRSFKQSPEEARALHVGNYRPEHSLHIHLLTAYQRTSIITHARHALHSQHQGTELPIPIYLSQRL